LAGAAAQFALKFLGDTAKVPRPPGAVKTPFVERLRDHCDSSLLTALSHTVRECRESLRLSQEEVAHRARLHRTYISDIERGARNLSLNSLVDLSRALELTTSELIITAEERLPKAQTIDMEPVPATTCMAVPTLQESLN
jgi:ribosome-binding protein aMBF1 (putative translation factor)